MKKNILFLLCFSSFSCFGGEVDTLYKFCIKHMKGNTCFSNDITKYVPGWQDHYDQIVSQENENFNELVNLLTDTSFNRLLTLSLNEHPLMHSRRLYLHPNINNYSFKISELIEFVLDHKIDGVLFDEILKLGGYIDLSNELRERIIGTPSVPLVVKAKLGDVNATKSIIASFNKKIANLVGEIAQNDQIVYDLLYLRSKDAYIELNQVFRSNQIYTFEINRANECTSWRVTSVNDYLFDCISNYYRTKPVSLVKHLMLMCVDEKTVGCVHRSYSKEIEYCISAYLSNVFEFPIDIHYPDDLLESEYVYYPPLNILNGYDFSCSIENYFSYYKLNYTDIEIQNILSEETKRYYLKFAPLAVAFPR